MGSIDPQVALLLLRQWGSYCRLVHLSRNTPTPRPLPCLTIECSNASQNALQWMLCLHLAAGTTELKEGRLRASAPILPLPCSIHSFIVFRPFPSSGNYLSSSVDLYNSLVDPQDSLTLESVGNSHLSQKVLSSKIEDRQFGNLFHSATLTDRARL